VKNRIATPPDELTGDLKPPTSRHEGNGPDSAGHDDASQLRRIQKRTITLVLTISVALGGVLLLLGFYALGKGFILGSLFSALNFFLMAVFLPVRFGLGRSKSTLISLASLCFRFSLLAIPLILAAKNTQFAIASTIAGLFMVQIVIFIDQLWPRQRNSVKA
jgi:hypothetical protein